MIADFVVTVDFVEPVDLTGPALLGFVADFAVGFIVDLVVDDIGLGGPVYGIILCCVVEIHPDELEAFHVATDSDPADCSAGI